MTPIVKTHRAIQKAVKIDGPFWFISHLRKRAVEYGVEL